MVLTRWIRVAGFTLQASEVAKVMMAIFTADYVVRRAEEVRNNIKGLDPSCSDYGRHGGFGDCRA